MAVVTPITDAPTSKAERLDLFCKGLCDGKTQEQAYIDAGYSPHNCRANANKFYRTNHQYIQAYISEHIAADAPVAYAIIKEIAMDKNEKGGIRLKAAQDMLDRAGFGAKQKIELTTKNADEMNTEELQDEISKLISENPFLAALLDPQKSPRVGSESGEEA